MRSETTTSDISARNPNISDAAGLFVIVEAVMAAFVPMSARMNGDGDGEDAESALVQVLVCNTSALRFETRESYLRQAHSRSSEIVAARIRSEDW
jgi:hypothetical protein